MKLFKGLGEVRPYLHPYPDPYLILILPPPRFNTSHGLVDVVDGFVLRCWRIFLHTHLILRLFTVRFTNPYTRTMRILVITAIWLGGLCITIWFESMRAVQCCQVSMRTTI